MTTEVTITEPSATPPEEAEAGTAAEAVVLAAETVVALAEGQAALAELDAAQTIAEHEGDLIAVETAVEEVEEHVEAQDRSIEALWQEQEKTREAISQMRGTLENLTASIQSPPPPAPELEQVTETLEPVTEAETTSLSIPEDTSAPTSEIATEVIAASVVEKPAREKPKLRIL